jgi:cytochrome c556
MKKLTKIVLAISAFAVAGSAMAQPKPEQFVKHRQSAFALMGWYFGPMAGVAKGEKPFNKDEMTKASALVATMAKLPFDSFVAGTESIGNTRALPTVWSDNGKFKEIAAKLSVETEKLASLAAAGDEAGFKKQFGVVGGTCKACHDDFQKKP